jgi:hypothetical protein
MSINRFQPHVLVLPEDDANRQVANGFLLDPSLSTRKIQVLPVAGGRAQVLELFLTDHVADMERYPTRLMVLLIDFDDKTSWLEGARTRIPVHLTDRVFILGALSKPEALRKASLGSYEDIGLALSKDCREGTSITWGHKILQHNAIELDRLRDQVEPILFPHA